MKPLTLMLACGLATWGQTQNFSFPFTQTQEQKEAEQADLQKAVNEAQTSSLDTVRVFEAFLEKYPRSEQRPDIEKMLAKAAVENKDNARTIRYGEKLLASVPDDVLMLDRVTQALLTAGGEENAQKALKYGRAFEEIIIGMGEATGKDAVQRQEERERARGRVLVFQARARMLLNQPDEAVRLLDRSFDVYPTEEAARERSAALLKQNKDEAALTALAEAFAVPDPRATDAQRLDDRLQLGQLYSKQHGSEKGLGDLILSAYDRTSTLVEMRHKRLLSLDPNSALGDPMEFTVTALDGRKIKLASLKGKVLVLDFWATWCGPCRAQHPLYEQLKEEFKTRPDVEFLAMNTDEDRSIVAPFLEQNAWDKATFFDDGLARFLQVSSIPTTVLIGKDGQVASRMNGFIADSFVSSIRERIQNILAASK